MLRSYSLPLGATPVQLSTVYEDSYATRVLADGASHYWKLDETSGLVAVDQIGGSANGTISGGVTLNQPGQVGTAMAFDGATGKVQTVATIVIPVAFSVELWLRFSASGERILFSTRGLATGEPFVCYVDPGTGTLQYYGAGGGFGNRSVRDGRWHHTVYTHDGATLRIYVDGVLDNPTASPRAAASTGPVAIGWDQPNAEFWNGLLDEVAIYPLVLTPTQIAAHAAAGLTAPAPPSVASGLDIPYRQLLLRADPGPVTVGDANVSLLSARAGGSVGGIVLGSGGGGGGGTVIDAFNRPNESPLANGWLTMGGIAGLQLLAQQAAAVDTDLGGNGSYWTTPFPADFRASVSVPVALAVPGFGSNSARVGLYVDPSLTAPALNGFSVYLLRAGDGTYSVTLAKTVNGTTTTPGGTVAIPFTAGDAIGIERTGTTLKSWRRTAGVWTTVATVTDASFPGALLASLLIKDDALVGRLDDFGSGPFTVASQAGAAFGASGMVLGPFSSGPLKLSSLYAVGAGSTLSIIGVPF